MTPADNGSEAGFRGDFMKRFLLAALAASLALAPAALSSMRGPPIYAPAYRPETPRVPQADVGSYEGIHKVAVLSAIGMRFDLQNKDPLETKNGTLDIAAWRLDDKAAAIVRRQLGGRFSFADVPYERAKLAPLRADDKHITSFEAFLKSVPAAGVDAFIIVRPEADGGLALQTTKIRDTILWTSFEIDVVDAHSLKVIAKSTARVNPPQASHPNFPGLMVGKDYQLDRTLAISPEKQEKLRYLTEELLNVTLPETIRSLKLGAAPTGE
jgi:hypothetical protein